MADQEIVKSDDAIPRWGARRGLRVVEDIFTTTTTAAATSTSTVSKSTTSTTTTTAIKVTKYEVDDFIVSPPSNEEGGFFHLRYGQRSKPRSSTYDRINQELGMTVEIKDGDPVIADLRISGSDLGISGSDKEPRSTLDLDISSGALTASTGNPLKPSSSHSTKPLFVFHLKDYNIGSTCQEPQDPVGSTFQEPQQPVGSTSSTEGSKDSKNCKDDAPTDVSHQKEQKNSDAIASKGKEKPELEVGFLKKDFFHMKEKVETSLTEKVQSLQISPSTEPPPIISPLTTPITTPLTTPHTSPTTKRKISGIVMDQGNTHSYFCTKAFQGANQQSAESGFASSSAGVGLSANTQQMSQQLESAAKAAVAMDPGQKMMGKKRRPKPSTLREMNFWAPTSM